MQSSRGTESGEQPGAERIGADDGQQATGSPESEAVPSPEPPREAEDLSGELARIEDRYRRALADLDNYRKRAGRELERRVLEAQESVLRDWLDVVDSVERAMQMEAKGPCREGLEAVLAQMDSVLQRHGVERTGARGERFDPERHEAVATRAGGESPDQTVLDVQRSGFARAERVIRPAQVVVARAGEHAG
ncbi:MAG: molecular chaperone GrpE [Solirubrobacteraceae bacterium]|jgi:molecular chaperone GrpE|nr:GrpE protein [Solirubrobacterales bacterium]MEA2216014.1 molecular chaperone GrpE [Solirubrobacteraceae bacterium]